jgi:hypothetical protein
MSGYSWNCQVPRAPLHVPGVTSHVMMSGTMSVDITLPSSLLRAHAPVLHPPRASVVASDTRSMQVAVSPCWEKDLPDVVLRILPCVLGPLPRRLLRCMYPFLPPRHRPSPRSDRVGAPLYTVPRLQYGALFEAAVIRSCSGPQVCSPPRSLLPLRHTPYGSRDFYVRASRELLPPHAPDMLTVRSGQLTVWGLAPHQIRSLVGCSPNAGAQPRLEAEAQRTLEGVGCSALFGWAHGSIAR